MLTSERGADGSAELFIDFSILKSILFLGEERLKVLQSTEKYGKLLTVDDGFLMCPICRRNKRLKRIYQDESGRNISVFCRSCKNEIRIDIDKGQCFESRSQ